MAGIELDGANQKVVLDADGDTYLEAATDDTVKVYVAGAQDFTITANTLTAESGSTIAAQALTATTVTASGIIKTDNATEATSTTDGSLQTDGGLSVVKDAVFGDDVKLLSDSSVVAFGADGDTTLTHTDGTGLTLNSTNKLCFNDATQFIQGASGTVLDIAATDEIELTATLIEAVGRLEVTGGAIFNEASADVDFRIESNGNANMFFVDGGDNTIKVASATNVAGLGVNPHLQVSASSPFISINTASADAGSGALIFTKGRSATVGTATVVQDNDSLGGIFWAAADGTDFTSAAASIKANIDGTPGGNDVPGEIVFATTADGAAAATDRLILNAAGNAYFTGKVGIGEDVPQQKLHIADASSGGVYQVFTNDTTGHTASNGLLLGIDASEDALIWQYEAKDIYFGTQGSERMRIFEDGQVGIAVTSVLGDDTAANNGVLHVKGTSGAEIAIFQTASNGRQIQFYNAGATNVGSIAINSGDTNFTTSSDYRLKENIDYTWDATSRLKQLKPARFNFIADETNILRDGFIAHEVSSIVPEAISGEKDAINPKELYTKEILYTQNDELPEGKEIGDVKHSVGDTKFKESIKPQGIDQSKLVPLLVKTVQELEARITTLENA